MLSPIFEAPLVVQVHIFAAIPAMLLGPVALMRRSRDWLHKLAGRLWVLAMAVLALSSFWINSLGWPWGFGPIHLLSVWVLIDLWRGIQDVRARRYVQHGLRMRSMYTGAMGIAGLFTLLPGRIMNRVIFPDNPELGPWVIGIGLVGLVLVFRHQRRGIWGIGSQGMVTKNAA